MEGISSVFVTTCFSSSSSSSLSSLQTHFSLNIRHRSPRSLIKTQPLRPCRNITVEQQPALDKSTNPSDMLPKIDKSGRFCSPRAARELALSIAYAACLEGSDPVRLLDKRINAPRESGYEFPKETLMEYNHMSFGGPPVTVHTLDEADELTHIFDRQSAIEAQVLAAPPKLVYSKLILR